MRDLLYSALCALMITAAACGGGDPPGGGNGDTDGGGNDVNLIEAIPGRWRVVRDAGQPPSDPREDDVRVDVDDPDCRQRMAEVRDILNLPPEGDLTGGPPGDACIVSNGTIGFTALILDDTSVRFDAREPVGINGAITRTHNEGVVRDDGTWMEYWHYNHAFNPPDQALVELEKVR